MAGNFVAGLVWGGLVAGLGLAVISPMAPLLGPKMGTPVVASLPAAEEKLAEPVAEEAKAAEPVAEAAKPAEPVAEAAKPAEPVAVTPDPAKTEPVAGAAAPEVTAEPAADASKDAILLPAQPEAPAAEPKAETGTASATIEPVPTEPEPAPAAPAPAEPAATATVSGETATTDPVAPAPAPAAPAPSMTAPADPVAPAPVAPAAVVEATPAPTEPAPAPVDPAAGVTTNRLPSIGQSAEEPAPAEAAPATAAAADAPPLVRFARPFENLTGNPPMAILLIDDGSDTLDRAALAALPFPVTFVIDPLAFNAPDAVAIYRAAGQEVAMLATGIPEGANASDLEQTFQTHDAVIPEAVAYVDLAQGGFQGNRPLATEVVTTLAPRGRGLVTYDQGLNAADQVAQRSGMAHGMIFRALDAEGEATPVVRRYLDRAAFKAAQEGGAIVIGQARPETVAALVEWSVEGRSSAVSIAPLSVLLQAGQ